MALTHFDKAGQAELICWQLMAQRDISGHQRAIRQHVTKYRNDVTDLWVTDNERAFSDGKYLVANGPGFTNCSYLSFS